MDQDTNKAAILKTYGPSILLHQFMLLFKDGFMVNQMLLKCDKLFKLKKKREAGSIKF